MYTNQAIKNNSPSVVILHPMPNMGSLHDPLAKDALACSKTKYPNAVEVIIGSNDWTIDRNQWGVIISRTCFGWIIIKDDIGRKAIPARWLQDNQGGDKYGQLQLGITGGNKYFYVK